MAPKLEDRQLGRQIAERRLQAGLSRSEFGLALGMSEAEIAAIERGETRISSTLLKVAAKVFATSADAMRTAARQAPAAQGAAELLALYEEMDEPARKELLRHARRLRNARA